MTAKNDPTVVERLERLETLTAPEIMGRLDRIAADLQAIKAEIEKRGAS